MVSDTSAPSVKTGWIISRDEKDTVFTLNGYEICRGESTSTVIQTAINLRYYIDIKKKPWYVRLWRIIMKKNVSEPLCFDGGIYHFDKPITLKNIFKIEGASS